MPVTIRRIPKLGIGEVRIVLQGTTPLVMHNPRLADPDDTIARQIASLTSKAKKTVEDRRAIERLEWFGSLYTAPDIDGPVVPTANLKECLTEAAKINRKGRQVTRTLHFRDMHFPLILDGPKELDVLFAEGAYTWRTSVVIRGQRTMRMRPIFREWRVEATATLIPDVLDADDLARVVALAGQVEGLGDGRVVGDGR